MALTKVTGQVIKNTTDVTVGVLTVTNTLAVGGTVSIGGTLTYEDVTNVDAVGLITARNGIVVGSGITLSKDGDIFATGITTVSGNVKVGTGITLSPDGDGFFTGVITATSYSGIDLSDVTGATGDFSIADKIVHTGDTNTAIRFPAADTISFETGGSEKVRIDSSGRLLINKTASTAAGYGTQNKLQIEGTDADTSSIQIKRNSNDSNGPYLYLGKSRGSSVDSDTVVQNGDEVGSVVYHGTDGTDANSVCAKIVGAIDGAPGSNDLPGRLMFMTTADGAATTTERLRINSSGQVLIGATSSRNVGGSTTNSRLQIEGTSTNTSSLSLVNNSADTAAPFVFFGKTRGNSVGESGQIQSGDTLGGLSFIGADGTDTNNRSAEITAVVNGSPANNTIPTNLVFSTSAQNATQLAERFRIYYTNTGNGGIAKFTSPASGDMLNLQNETASGQGLILGVDTNNDYTYLKNNTSGTYSMVFNVNGSERIRYGPLGQIGIAGANYGTAGQVLKSGGSGAAVSWGAGSDLVAESSTYDMTVFTAGVNADVIDSSTRRISLGFLSWSLSGSDDLRIQLRTSAGTITSGYVSRGGYVSNASYAQDQTSSGGFDTYGMSSNDYTWSGWVTLKNYKDN